MLNRPQGLFQRRSMSRSADVFLRSAITCGTCGCVASSHISLCDRIEGSQPGHVFGQAWNIMNPILLGLVYYLLLTFLQEGSSCPRSDREAARRVFFAFYFSGVVSRWATSVTSGSGPLLNTSFPTMLLPLSSVVSSLFSHASALSVYGVFHVLSGQYLGVNLMYLPLIFFLQLLISTGLALVFATATVYFRDTSRFLPYVLRIWMYLSPVIFLKDRIRVGSAVVAAQPTVRAPCGVARCPHRGIFAVAV